MNLIDDTYFILELTLPGLEKSGIRERFEGFVTKYQKRFLISILGEDCYKDFMLGLAIIPPEDIPAKWIELRDKLVNTEDRESPIANYVYNYYRIDNMTQTADTGEIVSDNENSHQVDAYPKIVAAWNDLVEWIRANRDWLETFLVDNGYIPPQPYYLNGVNIWWPCNWDKNRPYEIINRYQM